MIAVACMAVKLLYKLLLKVRSAPMPDQQNKTESERGMVLVGVVSLVGASDA